MSGTCGRRAPGVVPRAQARNQARKPRRRERTGARARYARNYCAHSGEVRRTQHETHETAAGAGAALAADRGAS